MKTALVKVTLRDGETLQTEVPLTGFDAEALWADLNLRQKFQHAIAAELLETHERQGGRKEITRYQFKLRDEAQDRPRPAIRESAGQRKVAKCRSLLGLAHRVLPPGVREDALDEWMDEIECAAVEGKPVLRRTLSILCRSLLSLALRSRRPARARGNGG